MTDPLDDFRQKFGFELEMDTSHSAIDEGLKQMVADMFEKLVPGVCLYLKIGRQELTNRLTVKFLDNPIMNAGVVWDRELNFEVSINAGLMLFFNRMINVLATRCGFVDDYGQVVQEPHIPFDMTVSMARNLMESFWEGENPAYVDTELHSKGQFTISTGWLYCSERFIIAHELAHVMEVLAENGIGGRANEYRELVESWSSGIGEEPGTWGNEYLADGFGCWILEFCGALYSDKWIKDFGWVGAQLALIMSYMLEEFHRQFYNKEPDLNNHPPSSLRIIMLRAFGSLHKSHYELQHAETIQKTAQEIVNEACKSI
jgi:hypothetical protein